ncbi:MAG TPA: MFS transporter [Luteitalea sp.]|nr:MFS transporter [Luteitalea sp.]
MTDHTRPGHAPTLLASLLHFDMSFMLWVLPAALGVFIAEDLRLTASMKGLLVAVPILTGSLLRVPIGLLADRFGGRLVGALLLSVLFLPLMVGWLLPATTASIFVVAATLGVAGSSFAVALPLASRWYPPEKQGLVMGIAAAGNSGTVIVNLVAPRLALAWGWPTVFGLAMLPLALVLTLFLALAREAPGATAPSTGRARVLAGGDVWWFCLFYAVTFGGYAGLSAFLPLLFRDQYGATPVVAGQVTALAALVGSLSRPFGGYIADRVGGVRVLSLTLTGVAIVYALAARLPAWPGMLTLVVIGMCCLGLGNGAVFQLVPLRFGRDIGVATGIVGAVGGVGGFLLPTLLGVTRQMTGSFGSAFAMLAVAAAIVALLLPVLAMAQAGWRVGWRQPVGAVEEA